MLTYLLGLFDLVAAERRIRVLAGALDRSQRDLAAFRADLARALDRNTEQAKLLDQVRGERSSSRRPLTRQQRRALHELIQTAEAHGIDLPEADRLDIVFLPEVSPGRGHDIRVWWADSDRVFMGQIDPYGNGSSALGDVEWVCNDDDENQGCPVCVPAEDEAEADDRG